MTLRSITAYLKEVGRLGALWQDEFRWAINKRGPEQDRVGFALMAPLLLVHTSALWRMGLPASAAIFQLAYVLHILLQVCVICCRRTTYVRYREALGVLATCFAAANTLIVATHQNAAIWAARAETPLGLLGLLAEANTSLWTAAHLLYGRILFCISLLALPAIAAAALLTGPCLCRSLLQAPAMPERLSMLYSKLSMIHTVLGPPVGEAKGRPMTQCLAANSWCILFLGVLLPLTLLYRLERRARREFYASRPELHTPSAALICLRPCWEQSWLQALGEVYVASCAAWLLACVFVVYPSEAWIWR